MAEKTLTVLEIGAGKNFERALKTAQEHPAWTVIAIDPEIRNEESPLPNLILIPRKFPDPFITRGGYKIDLVEMYHLGPPFLVIGAPPAIRGHAYAWLNAPNRWLAKKCEIRIVDNNVTQFYHTDRTSFMSFFDRFKKILQNKGYKVELEEVAADKFEKISFWDRAFLSKWTCHVMIKITRD